MSSTFGEEEECCEDDIVFDRQQLLIDTTPTFHRVSIKGSSLTVHRISSGKLTICAKTLGLCGAFFGLGLCVAVPDFTFSTEMSFDVKIVTSNSLFTYLLTARSLGYIIGSLIGGFLFDRYNRQFLVFLSLVLTSIFIVVTPWCYSRILLEINMMVLGITIGFLSTGGNVLCLDLWGKNSGPFMQALHFSFALGTLVAPLMVLSVTDRSRVQIKSSSNSINLSVETCENEYVIPYRIRKPNEEIFTESSFNISGNLFYQSNCDIKKLVANESSYQSHISFNLYSNKDNRTESAVIGHNLPSIQEVNNIQGTYDAYNVSIPNQCNLKTLNDWLLSDKDLYCKLKLNDIRKLCAFNDGIIKSCRKNQVLQATDCNCSGNLNAFCKNTNSFYDYQVSSESENFTFSNYSDDGNGEMHCKAILFHYAVIKKMNNSIIASISNLTCIVQFNADTFNCNANSIHLDSNDKDKNYGLTNYHFTYFMTGVVIFILSVLFFVFLYRNPRDPKSKQEEFRTKSGKASNICVDIFLVPLTAWFLFLCVGLQAAINQLLPLYAAKIHKILPSTSDNLQTIFSASFTMMRFISVFLAIRFSPDTLLVINIVMFSFGTLILTSLGVKLNEALCAGCSVIGLGLASMVPTTILWIEQYIRVSNKITMIFVVCSTLGEMLFPFSVYKLMLLDSDAFLYATVLVNFLSSLTLVCLWLIMSKHSRKFCLIGRSGYRLANQTEDEDLSVTNIPKCLKHN